MGWLERRRDTVAGRAATLGCQRWHAYGMVLDDSSEATSRLEAVRSLSSQDDTTRSLLAGKLSELFAGQFGEVFILRFGVEQKQYLSRYALGERARSLRYICMLRQAACVHASSCASDE
jgi:hypothetical protein